PHPALGPGGRPPPRRRRRRHPPPARRRRARRPRRGLAPDPPPPRRRNGLPGRPRRRRHARSVDRPPRRAGAHAQAQRALRPGAPGAGADLGHGHRSRCAGGGEGALRPPRRRSSPPRLRADARPLVPRRRLRRPPRRRRDDRPPLRRSLLGLRGPRREGVARDRLDVHRRGRAEALPGPLGRRRQLSRSRHRKTQRSPAVRSRGARSRQGRRAGPDLPLPAPGIPAFARNMTAQHAILLVDDEDAVLRTLRRFLTRDGFKVETARNAEDALAQLRAGLSPQVVISDYRMPGEDGASFLKRVRKEWRLIQRVLMTGHADISALEEAINASQIYRFLPKPWEERGLLATVRSAVVQ